MNNIWYEIFIDLGNKTITIETCDNLQKAIRIKKEIENSDNCSIRGEIYSKDKIKGFHIDKWEDSENPKLVACIN